MAAPAAIVGTRRGSKRGRIIATQLRREAAQESAATQRRRVEWANKIVDAYDADESGNLNTEELGVMLKDYSLQQFKREAQPSRDDLKFMFNLCGGEGESGRKIGRNKVLCVLDAWGEYMRQKERLEETFKVYDKDDSHTFDLEEMQVFLDHSSGGKVDPRVTEWVLNQSDLSQTGVLTELELARALCAFQLWSEGFTTCPVQRDALARGIKEDPALPKPMPKSQACCVL
mmetsp:Transcript_23902/g.66447  ORF Transcript_23902/g.66447 Transcript_23902/m.66447 type:complete len:230 (-) Transcript_23902:96-785(-)